jgi:preprotein translocase subunit SecY
VPLAALQTFAMISILRTQGLLFGLSTTDFVVIIITATAGTIFLMYLGELITEKKIGNGVSIMIFAGIVASLPSFFSQFAEIFDPGEVFTYLLFVAVALVTIVAVVYITEGRRNIPISHARKLRGAQGQQNYLPIRVNQAGVIPIIFAVSLIFFPTIITSYLANVDNEQVRSVASSVDAFLQNQLYYSIIYFLLVVVFTYFYTAVIFDPQKISDNLQRQGAFIPGIRPGQKTVEYLGKIVNRITLSGALFLGVIAILPNVVQGFTDTQVLAIGGTSILIAVSVVIEIIKNIESQMVMRKYESF